MRHTGVGANLKRKLLKTRTVGVSTLMTTEAKTKIIDEVKRFATDLNLSESQKKPATNRARKGGRSHCGDTTDKP